MFTEHYKKYLHAKYAKQIVLRKRRDVVATTTTTATMIQEQEPVPSILGKRTFSVAFGPQ